MLPVQQPLGQLVALHTHVPLTQAWPVEQLTQVAPPVPQALALVPATQVPALQQPLEHVQLIVPPQPLESVPHWPG